MCYREPPLVDIITEDEIITYGHVDPKKVPRIIEEHVINGRLIKEWIVKRDWWRTARGRRGTWMVTSPSRRR